MKALWIWYPGDFSIWLGNRMNCRRTERGAFFPPFWKADSHYPVVEFSAHVSLPAEELVHIVAEGRYNVKVDGHLVFGQPDFLPLAGGEHDICIKVWNQSTPPAVFVDSDSVKSGPHWRATYEDKEWIDESGRASDTSATYYAAAGCEDFDDPHQPPSWYTLPTQTARPLLTSHSPLLTEQSLYDFGRETFGFLRFSALKGHGIVRIYYGESREEALDTERCETLDRLFIGDGFVQDRTTGDVAELHGAYTLTGSKAFRYVYIICDEGITLGDVDMLYEYAPLKPQGTFSSSSDELNTIWQVAARTMELTTREFFIDGIKRDRWTWSGDAVQSYLMNYYLAADRQTVRRTTWLLRGKDPVTSHINTIVDYTFYWFIGIADYYLYTGDADFVRQVYPRMLSLMEYVVSRTDDRGLIIGRTGDWVFVDWADEPMAKQGELAFEQVLFARSLEAMAQCAALAGDDPTPYRQRARDVAAQLLPRFWDDKQGALRHADTGEHITRYANIFATLYGYLTPEQQATALRGGRDITTPYMRFYELDAMCQLGQHRQVLQQMLDYWGGMLREGATAFWEKYIPSQHGTEHLAMYGRPYGKSLCHAWGASPIYLLGKHYLGVRPTKAGYSEYVVEPHLGDLEWIEGTVPTPFGTVHVRADRHSATATATGTGGTLRWAGQQMPLLPGQTTTIKADI